MSPHVSQIYAGLWNPQSKRHFFIRCIQDILQNRQHTKTAIIPSFFLEHKGIKLQVNYHKQAEKSFITWRLTTHWWKTKERVTEKIKETRKYTLRRMKTCTQPSNSMGHSNSSSKREINSIMAHIKKQEWAQITFSQEIGKRTNPTVYRTIKIKKEKHKFEWQSKRSIKTKS